MREPTPEDFADQHRQLEELRAEIDVHLMAGAAVTEENESLKAALREVGGYIAAMQTILECFTTTIDPSARATLELPLQKARAEIIKAIRSTVQPTRTQQ